MVAEVLGEHGFEVYAVANAKDALRHLTCGSPCDILLTDINLPGSIDGAALARLARELRPNLPVVYASGSYSRIERARCGAGLDLRAEAVQSGQARARCSSEMTTHCTERANGYGSIPPSARKRSSQWM